MFPYYARFISRDRRIKAFEALMRMDKAYRNFLCIPKSKDCTVRYLRYCPLCAEADRREYKETYWHRIHQMTGVEVCPVHGCQLCNSDIAINSKGSPSLITAEESVGAEDNTAISSDDTERRLATYTADVFSSGVELNNDIPLGKFLHSRLENTKYLSLRGEQRNMSMLHNDFSAYYHCFSTERIMEQWQLQKVFSNDRLNTHEICMIAMFLNIPVSELVHIRLPDAEQREIFDAKIMAMHEKGMNYRQIADELNASYDVVKAIGEGRYGTYHYCSQNPQKSGSKKYDWERIDAETLPLVKQAIGKIRADNTVRPQRITTGLIERMLEMPKKRLNNCPKCKEEIEKHHESQEEHWARVVAWAARHLVNQGASLHYTSIHRLTNIRKSGIIQCMPYLREFADDRLYGQIARSLHVETP